MSCRMSTQCCSSGSCFFSSLDGDDRYKCSPFITSTTSVSRVLGVSHGTVRVKLEWKGTAYGQPVSEMNSGPERLDSGLKARKDAVVSLTRLPVDRDIVTQHHGVRPGRAQAQGAALLEERLASLSRPGNHRIGTSYQYLGEVILHPMDGSAQISTCGRCTRSSTHT